MLRVRQGHSSTPTSFSRGKKGEKKQLTSRMSPDIPKGMERQVTRRSPGDRKAHEC